MILYYFFVFIFGLCIGSFLNCFIYRIEQKKKLSGRSFCPNCKKQLKWQDLIPIFSFIFLGGKCRYCKKKISWQYPAVELATGIIFILTATLAPIGYPVNFIKLLFWLYIASALIVIFVYDLKHYIIPDKILLPAIAISFIYLLIFNFNSLGNHLFSAFFGFLFFFSFFFFSKGKWMGFGDVKLAILMGFLLGFSNMLVALFFAFFFGAIIGIISIIFKRKNLKSEIPFGPFLIFGTFLAIFSGQEIINWYLNLII